MKKLGFMQTLRAYLFRRSAASLASDRIRSVLASDRDPVRSEKAKQLNAELAEVLARYFTVTDLACRMQTDVRDNRILYALEAELIH